MAAYYVFKQADIDLATANGIVLYINDVLAKAGSPVNQGDKVKATANSGKFILNSSGTITPRLYFSASQNNYFFNPVDKYNPTVVIATISIVGPYDTDTKFNLTPPILENVAPVMGYVLTASEITSLKNGGVQSVKVKGVDVVSNTNIYVGDSVELVLPSNKYWATAPVFYSTDEWGDPVTKPFTINGTNTATITYANNTGNSWSKIKLGSIANVVITGYTLTMTEVNRLKSEGATRIVLNGSDVNSQKVLKAGDALRILIGVGKMWSVPPSFTNGADRLPFTTSDRWADVTFADNPSGSGWTQINIGTIIDKPAYTFRQSDIDNFNNSGVVMTVNGIIAEVGTPLNIGDILVATAGNGRYFYMAPDSAGNDKPSIYMNYYNNSIVVIYFTLSEDKKTATLTIPEVVRGNDIYGFVSKTEQKTNVVGTNNVYLINEQILKQVNAKRFKVVSDGGDTPNETVYDYGQFILSLLSIPFTVPADNILQPESIILANFDTGVSAPKINTDIIEINLGEIEVVGASNNLLDYANTVALLHLPRMDTVAIDLEYVINQKIKIVYLLDCYTGKATVNIYSDKINSPIVTKTVDIGVNIPYANTHNNAVLDNGNIEIGGDNGVKTPFIELVKSDTLLSDGLFTIPVVDEAILNTATGFIQVENVELKTGALRNEKEMLLNILNNGVIIK